MEFSGTQLRILIDERKHRNAEYHATTNKKKYLFWNEIAEKLNDQENTNYFTGDECHKKFLSLTKAFYISSDCLGSTKAFPVNNTYYFRRRKNRRKKVEQKRA
jgi:hypothetical protein